MSRRNFLRQLVSLPFAKPIAAAVAAPVAQAAGGAGVAGGLAGLALPTAITQPTTLFAAFYKMLRDAKQAVDDCAVFTVTKANINKIFNRPLYTSESLRVDRERMLRGEEIEQIRLKVDVDINKLLDTSGMSGLSYLYTKSIEGVWKSAHRKMFSILVKDATAIRKTFLFNVVFTEMINRHFLYNDYRMWMRHRVMALTYHRHRAMRLALKELREIRKEEEKTGNPTKVTFWMLNRALRQAVEQIISPDHYRRRHITDILDPVVESREVNNASTIIKDRQLKKKRS
jgi:hypothetical protein